MSSSPTGVAYLILGHHRPGQVRRLAERIVTLSTRARVFIHWDGSSADPPPDRLPPRSEVISTRIPTEWGKWSLVAAEFELLRAARVHDVSWYVLISGVDWPARDLADWEHELDSSAVDAWMVSNPIQNRWLNSDAVPLEEDQVRRYEDRWMIIGRPTSGQLRRITDGVVRRCQTWAGRGRRYPALMNFYDHGYGLSVSKGRLPADGWTIHTGPQWMTLGRRAADAVLATSKEVVLHFRRTLIPDEAFIHTVIMNAPELRVADRPTSYAPWDRFGLHGGLDLVPEDAPAVIESGAAFARKVPIDSAMVEQALDLAVAQSAKPFGRVQ